MLTSFGYLLDTLTIFLNYFSITWFTSFWYNILCFTDMAESNFFSWRQFMVADADRTVFTLWDISALFTNNSWGISFLIYNNCNFSIIFQYFLYSFLEEIWVVILLFLIHIYEKNIFFWFAMCKFFVVHRKILSKISIYMRNIILSPFLTSSFCCSIVF